MGELMKKRLMLLFCLIIMMGCQRSLLPYTDEEAKQFENKLKKAGVEITEIEAGKIYMILELEFPSKKDESTYRAYYKSNIYYFSNKSTFLNTHLQIVYYRPSKEWVRVVSYYEDFANGEFGEEGTYGSLEYKKSKEALEYEDYCSYLFKDKKTSTNEETRVCTIQEQEKIEVVYSDMKKAFTDAGISDESVMQYLAWYTIKAKDFKLDK